MIVGALNQSHPTRAEDLVCGDGDKDVSEECDDGNLQNGDGCSSTCSQEFCGNLSLDRDEQCDDGNLQNNDGCNRYCQIEFCGDRVIQEPLGEECDDGNGISGDGCAGTCILEAHSAAPNDPAMVDVATVPAASPFSQSSLPYAVVMQAKQALTFMTSQAFEVYENYVTDVQTIQLETIVKKMTLGKIVSTEEQQWAMTLSAALQETALAEHTHFTELVKQFTPESTTTASWADSEALNRAVTTIRRGGLSHAVMLGIARLELQGMDLTREIPVGYEKNLTPQSSPVSVLETLKTLRDITRKYATTDVQASLVIIRTQAEALKQALPLFEREYGLDVPEAELLRSAIVTESLKATEQNLDGVIKAIGDFITLLEENNVISRADIAAFDIDSVHAVAPLVDSLSAAAPSDMKEIFERGTVTEQRSALLEFLASDVRSTELRRRLRENGRTDLDARYESLVSDIMHIGETVSTGTVCRDSVSEALSCVSLYLADLEDAVRSRNFLTRLVGNLQDYFDIGS